MHDRLKLRGARAIAWVVVSSAGLIGLNDVVLAATTVTRTSSFDYDTNTGLLIKEVVEPGNSDLCLVTEHKYTDGFGNKTQTINRNCNGSAPTVPGGVTEAAAPSGSPVFAPRTNTFTYGTDGRYLIKVTNAEGYTEDRTYDLRNGAVATVTGPNQLTTIRTYDAMGRQYTEQRADGTYTRTDYVYCSTAGITIPSGSNSEACPTVYGVKAAYSIKSGAYTLAGPFVWTAIGPYTKVYYDGQGRELRTETQGFDGSGTGTLVYQDTKYDNKGRAIAKSRPYYSGAAVYLTTYVYDDLGRVIETNSPTDTAASGAITKTVYNGLTTSVTDPDNHTTSITRDVAGQEVTVTDANGQTLSKAFDPLGNLVRTTDAKGNVTSLVYDLRGRKTGQYDPDMGIWTYVYNAAGELVKQTDAKGQVTTMTFDVAGRMKTRNGPGQNSTWYYNANANGSSCGKGIGKLCEVTGDNGYRRQHSYDSLGRPSTTTTTVGTTPYVVTADYDSVGRLNTQTYPTGIKVRNIYTALGYLKEVQQVAPDGVTLVQKLLTTNTVNAVGQPTQFTYGNNVVTSNIFSETGRLTSTTATVPLGVIQGLQFTYDAAGLLTQRQDVLTQVTASYQYDALNRLTKETRQGGSLTTPEVTAWAYDSIGNIQSRTVSGTTTNYTYNASGSGSNRPHAVGAVGGYVNGTYTPRFYTYDTNGNLTSVTGGGGQGVTWTGFDKVSTLTKGTKQLSYQYDPEYERVQEVSKLNGAVQRTTVYLNPAAGTGLFYEEESGVGGTKRKHYLSAGGATIAMLTCTATPCTTVSNTTTQYWHKDHLGSTTVITSATNAVLERLAYEPFGKRRNSNGVTDETGTLAGANTDRGFTGHEHMDEVGLINMNGRVYDPGIARFLSADPLVQNPSALQSYNRYAYGWNSPLNGSDPNGYNWLSDRWHAVIHSTIGRAVVIVAVTYFTAGAASGYVTGVYANAAGMSQAAFVAANGTPFLASVAGGAAAGFSGGLVASNGRIKDALQGAVVGGVSGGALNWAGSLGASGNTVGQYAVHAAVGCGRAAISGGNCGSGALAAVVSKTVSVATDKEFKAGSFSHFAVSTVAGGAVEEMTGGSFVNGATTASFQYLFNCLGRPETCGGQKAAAPPAGAANAPGGPLIEPSWQEIGMVADGVMTASMVTPIGPEVQAAKIGLTKLMSYGVETTAARAGPGLVEMTMGAGRSASADFAALATNYGAAVESVTTKAGQVIQRFNVGEATVVLRDFGRTAGTTIQVTVKGVVDGIKMRY